MRKFLKAVGIILLAVVVAAGGFIGYLTATEYRPQETAPAEFLIREEASLAGSELTVLTWNIGYGGLDAQEDFFMDGGSMVYPRSQDAVVANVNAIHEYLDSTDADIILLQEIDRNSARSGHLDELEELGCKLRSYAYATNYRCAFVPFPWPPIGKVDSGIATLTTRLMQGDAERVNLPCPFSWPVRVANLKRGLLVNHFPLENGKTLTVVNLHLEAYDDGEGKIAQTKVLMELLQKEYAAGNYVLAGGDFNQTFPGMKDRYPLQSDDLWAPGELEADSLPQGWQFVCDADTPTCRSLDRALDLSDPSFQYYVIDGFLLSPNITLNEVQTQNLGFANSDHNPVRLSITLN